MTVDEMLGSKGSRAQGTMEYLTSHWWMLLVFAVALVIAFFVVGSLGSMTSSGLGCFAQPQFYCAGASYSHSTATLVVAVGQDTGIGWSSANIVFVPQGTPVSQGIPMISFSSLPANTYLTQSGYGLPNRGEALLYLPVNNVVQVPIEVGTPLTGSIWAHYTYYVTVQGGARQQQGAYVQMATVNLKAS